MSADDLEELELRAFIALRGGTETPERDIAALFRSKAPISPELREMLADALEGRGVQTITLKAQGVPQLGAYVRSIGRRHRSLIRGKEARRLAQGEPDYRAAIETVAKAHGVAEKTVETDYTLAGKAAEWIARQSNRVPSEIAQTTASDVSYLEHVYLDAMRSKKDPTVTLDRILKACEIMDREGPPLA